MVSGKRDLSGTAANFAQNDFFEAVNAFTMLDEELLPARRIHVSFGGGGGGRGGGGGTGSNRN